MKLAITWAQLAQACDGKLTGAPEDRVDVVASDTRTLKPGQAFVALKGASFDAHDLLEKAAAASGWIVHAGAKLPAKRPAHLVEVDDTLKALQRLATWHRLRFDIPIAAVAGSNGKTTTKQMLRAICETQGLVCATEGNLNNQFGLPFSLLELGPDHHFGVFELGESKFGDIDELARILQPTVGVLTNVGPAHLEWLGDLEGVFRCLSELVKAAPKALVAVNLDDPYLARLAPMLHERALGYGRKAGAKVRLEDAHLAVDGKAVALEGPAFDNRIQRVNAAAAAAGALGLGLGSEAIAKGLAAFKPAPMRFESRRHKSGATLVVDAYNANPGSMRAGIESFCEAHAKEKRILVLGDMKELGEMSPKLHRELVGWAASQPVDAVFVAGREMAEAARSLNGGKPRARLHGAVEPSQWLDALRAELGPGVAVYVKASRAMQFERVADSL